LVPRPPLIPTSSAESKRHLRLLCHFAGAICTIGIVIASLLPGDNRPQSGVAPGQVEHLVAYLVAAGLLALGSIHRRARLLVCASLIALAAILEFLQIWIPGRNAEFIGFAGSAMGAVTGYAGAALLLGFGRQDDNAD
jgi:VanZ family protein